MVYIKIGYHPWNTGKKYKLGPSGCKKLTKTNIRAWTRNNAVKKGVCSACEQPFMFTDWHHESYTPNIYKEICTMCHRFGDKRSIKREIILKLVQSLKK